MTDGSAYQEVSETVSSSLTFFYKFVFTTIWSGGFGLGTVLVFSSRNPQPEGMRFVFASLWLVGSFVLWAICGRLKKVRVEGKTMSISNYRKEIRVSTDQIAVVKQNRLINLRPVIVTFKKETPFGRRVISCLALPSACSLKMKLWRGFAAPRVSKPAARNDRFGSESSHKAAGLRRFGFRSFR